MTRYLITLCAISLLSLAACGKKDVKPDAQPVEPNTQTEAPASQPESSDETPEQPDEANSGLPAPADVAAAPTDAVVTSSGLASKVLVAGDGTVNPGSTSVVRVHYTGWTTDGKMFDSSVLRNESISFPLDKVIKGWQEGVQLMVEGELRRFWIPADLAYGETPEREGAPAGMLVFDVELIAIEQP
jgi:FKBP-type peptidyl-prolyl cis-trans isomerase